MKGDVEYWAIAHLLDVLIWGGELANEENLPQENSVVFVSNHAAALGPVAVTSCLPVRIFPWVISDMLDWNKAADYLHKDFVEPQLHIPPPLSMGLSRLISQISTRLLRSVECIPVWQGDALMDTYYMSINYLVQGRNLLIFPEDPNGPMDELYKMRPFKKGFARLGEMYYMRTKKILRFYPLAVHPGARIVKAGKPISFNPFNDPVKERVRIKYVLESMIHDLYLSITLERHIGIPLPH